MLAAATLVLVLSPATVSFPIALAELVVLVGGLAAMLAIDFALLRRAFGPLAAADGVHARRRSAAARGAGGGAGRGSGGGRADGGVQ